VQPLGEAAFGSCRQPPDRAAAPGPPGRGSKTRFGPSPAGT